MKDLIVGDRPTVARLADRLKRASSHAEYQRIQCVLIRATLGSSATQIAQLLGWSTATVHVLHSRWAKEGDAIFDLRGRGGWRHQYLTPELEQELLAPFVERAQTGGMLTVAEIQQAYQEQSGKAVAPSTIYRLLDRHGWRKVVPRPSVNAGHDPPLSDGEDADSVLSFHSRTARCIPSRATDR
jgi:transposase